MKIPEAGIECPVDLSKIAELDSWNTKAGRRTGIADIKGFGLRQPVFRLGQWKPGRVVEKGKVFQALHVVAKGKKPFPVSAEIIAAIWSGKKFLGVFGQPSAIIFRNREVGNNQRRIATVLEMFDRKLVALQKAITWKNQVDRNAVIHLHLALEAPHKAPLELVVHH